MAVHARATINLEPGDDPVELWLTGDDVRWWIGDLDLNWRRAGGAFGLDFERGYGSWWGGLIVDSAGDPTRWAQDGDVIVTAEVVGDAAVKVTMEPGPGLTAGATFVNLPFPDSVGLSSYPEVRNRPLPVLNAWAVAEAVDTAGTSTDIGPSARPEYVHDASWSGATWTTENRGPEVTAKLLADRYLGAPGEFTIDCEAAPVRIGERWHVRVSSVADLLIDGVVIGIPSLEARAGDARMTVRMWVMSVTSTSA